jgi:hypothetical protein
MHKRFRLGMLLSASVNTFPFVSLTRDVSRLPDGPITPIVQLCEWTSIPI